MYKTIFKAISIVLVLIFVLAGCTNEKTHATQNDNTANETELMSSSIEFGATYMTMNNPFFEVLDNEIKTYVANRGDKVATLDPQLDVDKQISCVEELILQDVKLIFLNPADYMGIKPALERAKKARVPVIVVDAPVFDDSLVAATITSDNYKAGVLCANDVVKKFGKDKKVDIVLLEHPSARSAQDRIDGFVNTISKYPNMTIAERKSSNGQLEMAMTAMNKIIENNKKIDVVMALNDPSAIGAIAALKAADRLEGVLVYGVDGSEDARNLIKSGEMTATVAQSPRQMGRTAAEYAYKLLEGESIPREIKVKVLFVDQSNVDEYIE